MKQLKRVSAVVLVLILLTAQWTGVLAEDEPFPTEQSPVPEAVFEADPEETAEAGLGVMTGEEPEAAPADEPIAAREEETVQEPVQEPVQELDEAPDPLPDLIETEEKAYDETLPADGTEVMFKAADDSILTAENFPDENFLAELRKKYPDGLTETGAANEASLEIATCGIDDLTGIALFPGLVSLYCGGNNLTGLDLSGNTALKTLYCQSNYLTALDLSGNPALTELNCNGNELTRLNVTGCTALTKLCCNENELTVLDVSRNPALTELHCYGNCLTALNVSKNTALTNLECDNNRLTSLNISNNTALKYLCCYSNSLTGLDVSHNTALTELACGGNKLSALDVSRNTALVSLNCVVNRLTRLDVSHNTALKWLYCEENKLTALDVSRNTALAELYCYENSLTALDVSANPALTYLDCSGNRLNKLDVSRNTGLKSLYLSGNRLTVLDISNNTALKDLSCDSNALTGLDVSNNPSLECLGVSGNYLTALDLFNNTALTQLWCHDNRLNELDVSKNTGLTNLDCAFNRLTRLDVSGQSALKYLECSENQMTALDLSGNHRLQYVSVGQSFPVLPLSDGSRYTVDMKALTGSENLDRVSFTDLPDGIGYDPDTGIVTMTKPKAFTYTYDTRCPDDDYRFMSVQVKPIKGVLTSVALIPSGTVTLDKGETLRLNAEVKDPGVVAVLSWSSSAPKIASAADGLVTANAEGTAKIKVTAASGGVKKTAAVTIRVVDPYKPTAVTLDRTGTVTLDLGTTLTLTPTLQPAAAIAESFAWKSSSAKIANVDANGLVTPVKEGTVTVTVTAKYGKVKKTAKVKVKVVDPRKPTSVVLSRTGTVILPNTEPLTLTAGVLPATADQAVLWSLDKAGAKCATLENGVLTPIEGKTGTATVTATAVYGKVKKTAKVKVLVVDPSKVARVTLTGETKLTVGGSAQLSHLVEPLTVDPASYTVAWKFSAPKIVGVTQEGAITALKKGTAVITVTVTQGTGKTAIKKSAKLKIRVSN